MTNSRWIALFLNLNFRPADFLLNILPYNHVEFIATLEKVCHVNNEWAIGISFEMHLCKNDKLWHIIDFGR